MHHWSALLVLLLCASSHGFTSVGTLSSQRIRQVNLRYGYEFANQFSYQLYSKTQKYENSVVTFSSPLLEEGYPPTVDEYKNGSLQNKPLLVYLPGFDGTLLAPFLQLPELGSEFDVKGLTVDMKDRSSVEDLCNLVIDFIDGEVHAYDENDDNDDDVKESGGGSGNPLENLFPFLQSKGNAKIGRPVYLAGESFGGILAIQVAMAIEKRNRSNNFNSADQSNINLQGVTLINPATCYNNQECKLSTLGPPVAQTFPLFYPFQLGTLLPLFTDAYALPQLLLILQGKGLPSVIDDAQKEAYMGRMAFSLPFKLKFMPQATLQHRLEVWLQTGCNAVNEKEFELDLQKTLGSIPVLIVAGEVDQTLPSLQEADRLSKLFKKATVHVVDGAGHASTSGSRVDLTALMRGAFGLTASNGGRKAMKEVAAKDKGGLFYGMEERYDGARIGLSPLLYWSKGYYSRLG